MNHGDSPLQCRVPFHIQRVRESSLLQATPPNKVTMPFTNHYPTRSMSGRNWGRVMRILCMSAMLGVLLNGCKERGDIWNIRDGQRMRFSQDFSDKNLPPGASATSIVIAEVHLPAPPDFTKTLIQPRGPIVIVIADEGQSGSSKIGIKSDFGNYQQ